MRDVDQFPPFFYRGPVPLTCRSWTNLSQKSRKVEKSHYTTLTTFSLFYSEGRLQSSLITEPVTKLSYNFAWSDSRFAASRCDMARVELTVKAVFRTDGSWSNSSSLISTVLHQARSYKNPEIYRSLNSQEGLTDRFLQRRMRMRKMKTVRVTLQARPSRSWLRISPSS